MFGVKIRVENNGAVVNLRPFCKDDIQVLVDNFSSMKVHLYTMGRFGYPYENELDWYDKCRKSPDDVIWAIVPEGSSKPIGTTGIHDIHPITLSCHTGIIIWDPAWWGKGVATCAHLARTLFAADYLNRFSISSAARVDNHGSVKALQRVGYTISGTDVVDDYKDGRWLDTYRLKWLHPEKISVLFPNGAPSMYQEGIARAKIALDKARSIVSFP